MATAPPPPQGTDPRSDSSCNASVEEPHKAAAAMEVDEEAQDDLDSDSSGPECAENEDPNFFFASRSVDLSPQSTSAIVLGEMMEEPASNSILSFMRTPAQPIQQEA